MGFWDVVIYSFSGRVGGVCRELGEDCSRLERERECGRFF